MKTKLQLKEGSEHPHIVLYQPDIPGNTGTILRMAACLGLTTHIIEPAGFRVDDRNLRRAGMDYLEIAALQRHTDWESFEAWRKNLGLRLVLATTKSQTSFFDFRFSANDCLLFGRESAGVPDDVLHQADAAVTIPMVNNTRSLNLAVSVAMVASEALRQLAVQ